MRIDLQWRENLPLALPVIVGQIGHIAASVADSMMVGALGTIPLAAVSLASSIQGFRWSLALAWPMA